MQGVGYYDGFRPGSNDALASREERVRQDRDMDRVELSPESLELARLNGNPATAEVQALQVTNTGEDVNVPANGVLPVGMTNTLAGQSNTLLLPMQVGNTPGNELNIPSEEEFRLQAVAATEAGIKAAAETEAVAGNTQPKGIMGLEAAVAPQGALGVVENEPIRPLEAATAPGVNPAGGEAQVAAEERLNDVFRVNNAAVPRGENAVENTPMAPEVPRSEQQVLLQNVGSQLAQAFSPPNVISVLG
jgi:hypothetical protein